ncbi:MAG: xanthine dehydrogenase family protein molybdopterin-binding subunit, partial [Proteobacteria bacterium]|nr:xanthine dehydrogenase family protein molybdopterin-binding subunit [Pseudomonadota bacterium]
MTGSAVFGVDVQVAGMLVGTVKHSPVWGGTLKSLDPEPALAVRGVHKVITTDNAIIVVGEGYWQAKKGLDALAPEWNPGKGVRHTSDSIGKDMRAALNKKGAIAV